MLGNSNQKGSAEDAAAVKRALAKSVEIKKKEQQIKADEKTRNEEPYVMNVEDVFSAFDENQNPVTDVVDEK